MTRIVLKKHVEISRHGSVLLLLMVMVFGAPSVRADQRRLTLSLGAGGLYNDNIFFASDNEIDDYITMLSGGLEFINRQERLDLSFSGRAVNQDYADNNDLDGLDQNYKGQVSYWLASHFKAMLDGSFSRDTQPDRDIETTGMVLGTATRDTQEYGCGFQYDLTDITSAFLSFRYRAQEYGSPQYSDYSYQQAGLRFTRRMDKHIENTTSRLNFNYAHYDYSATELDYYGGTIGFLYRLTELWHLQIDLGVRYTESEFLISGGRQTNNDWGGVGELEFGYQGNHGAAGLTMSHDVGAASGLDGSLERSSAVLDFYYRFAEKVRAGISAGYFHNIADSGDLALEDTDENTSNMRPYIRAGLTNNLFLDASYSYSQVEDNLDDTTRERSLYLIRLIWEYPVVE
jgi:hypothetical protein